FPPEPGIRHLYVPGVQPCALPISTPTPPSVSTCGRSQAQVETDGGVAVVTNQSVSVEMEGQEFDLEHGSVVIAAITSCTNTSNRSEERRVGKECSFKRVT